MNILLHYQLISNKSETYIRCLYLSTLEVTPLDTFNTLCDCLSVMSLWVHLGHDCKTWIKHNDIAVVRPLFIIIVTC